jgi:hypothetical protein
MQEFLETIENSAFPTYVRETASWPAYSTVLALHTFGMAFLVGFWLNAITGLILTSLATVSLLRNWDFYVKLAAIAVAIVALTKMRRLAFTHESGPDDAPASPEAKRWAKIMLFFWFIAVLGGRLTAYATNIRIQSAAAVAVAAILLLVFATFLARHTHRTTSAEARV